MTPTTASGPGRRLLATAGPVVLPAALFLAAALAVPAVRGESAIDAGRFGLVAGALAIALVGAATAVPSRWLRPSLALAAVIGLCAHALLLAKAGVPLGHDTSQHLWGLYAYGSELRDGSWVPLWLHRLGLGMPLPVFYSPLVFWIATPLLLALGPGLTLKALLLGAGAAAAAVSFWVARRVTGDGAAALVAAAAMAFAPYRLLDAHYRVAFAETAGFALLPLALYCSWRFLQEGGGRRLAAAAGTAALLLLTHALTALMAAVVAGVGFLWLLARGAGQNRVAGWTLLRRFALLGGLAVLLSACFLLPVATDLPATAEAGFLRDDHVLYRDAGLEPSDFLLRRSWNEIRVARSAVVDQPMPLYFGSALLALLLTAGIGALRLKRGSPGAEGGSSTPWIAMAVVTLLLTLRPFAQATAGIPWLPSLQFPWRFLTVATCAAAVAGALAAAWLSTVLSPRWRRWSPAVITALLVADAQPMTGAAEWLPDYDGFGLLYPTTSAIPPTHLGFEALDVVPPMRVAGAFLPPGGRGRAVDVGLVSVYREWQTPAVRASTMGPASDAAALAQAGVALWLPRGARVPTALEPLPYATWRRGPRAGVPLRSCKFERAGGRIRIELPAKQGQVVVREQCFPGWQVRTATGWEPASCSDEGTLQANVKRGQESVEFRFQRWTAARTLGWLGTALGLALALALLRR